MEKSMIVRIGTFFILVGLAMLVVFIGSIMGKDTRVIYLLLAFASEKAGASGQSGERANIVASAGKRE
jgi:hypothetical protein